MAAAVDEFTAWLGNKLKALNTDEGVFSSYITGILDGDETLEEKTEALDDILSQILESDIKAVCKEIMDMWKKLGPQESPGNVNMTSEDVDAKLARLLENQTLTTTKQKQYTEEEKKIREAILAQYSQMTDDEGDEEEVETSTACEVKDSRLERNTNALVVQQAEKEKREQSKIDSQKKKEKDREDREKQKQLKEEKKEKRKTTKGERKR